ncbi:MAG: response regulator [Cyanobacteria bacterium SBLK]|nr:response regulator [Cyanobacteria bacterium SBLK]
MNSHIRKIKGTILIIDDNPVNLEVLYGTLSKEGYEILVEMDGESGIEQARKNQPDLIILDIMMPGIDGFETCRRLKSDPQIREISVIFITAISDIEHKVKGLQLGAVDYITKPFYEEEVITRVGIHFQLRDMSAKLEKQNQQLSQALDDLKAAQVQLVQSEKMSGLGRLVAGIAHEINNPLNFLQGNLLYLEGCIAPILSFLDRFRQEELNLEETLQIAREELDIPFLQDDLPKLFDSMTGGTERIRKIILNLRDFSYLDEVGFKAIDIHQCLNDTLVLFDYRLKRTNVEIISHYDRLPVIECHAGHLNQAFANILTNAIDAIENKGESHADHRGRIEIYTRALNEDLIQIGIKDNGIGIAENIHPHIFDPFFTTKPVGSGKGLGLSISYRIITEGHGGRIYCRSVPGNETEFTIELPIREKTPTTRAMPASPGLRSQPSQSVPPQSR